MDPDDSLQVGARRRWDYMAQWQQSVAFVHEMCDFNTY